MRISIIVMLFLVSTAGSGMQRNLNAPPLQIEGAKISSQDDAARIAFNAYAKRMNFEVLATENVREFSIISLGYDLPDFAQKGDRLWEMRVLTVDGQLRAILWVNPNSGAVHFVSGPWEIKRNG